MSFGAQNQAPAPSSPARGRISAQTISAVHDRVDIVTEVGDRLELKRAGGTFLGLCPFHGEKTPSFHVSPTRQRYHCFGCGVDGDAIDFVMKHDGTDFLETMESLASRLGVALVYEESPEKGGAVRAPAVARSVYDRLTTVCAQAARHWMSGLGRSKEASDYAQSRGLTPEIVQTYGIGFAFADPQDLLGSLTQAGVKIDDLVDAGLVVRREEEGEPERLFDRFRDRLIFPIRDTKGSVIGFGGRIIHDRNPKAAKYLNSPETVLFAKHKVLYGLHEARASIMRNKRVYVAEGYMDVVAMAMHGLTNTVAAMGTALTADHAQMLLRFSRHICFVFDGDKAGQAAAWKAAMTLLPLMASGMQVDFLTFDHGQDPDEFLAQQGKSGFEAFERTRAQSLTAFITARLVGEHGRDGLLHSLEAKANFAKAARELALQIPKENSLRHLFLREIDAVAGLARSRNDEGSSAWRQGGWGKPWSRPVVRPHFEAQTIWQQIIRAIQLAPEVAMEQAGEITAWLNSGFQQEMDVALALDALEARGVDADASKVSREPDQVQAAADLLRTAPVAIAKHRQNEQMAHLRRLKEQGALSELDYLNQVMLLRSAKKNV